MEEGVDCKTRVTRFRVPWRDPGLRRNKERFKQSYLDDGEARQPESGLLSSRGRGTGSFTRLTKTSSRSFHGQTPFLCTKRQNGEGPLRAACHVFAF